MVSNASEDLPEPDRPVITISLSRGRSRSMFLRLCVRAPRMRMNSIAIEEPAGGGWPSSGDGQQMSLSAGINGGKSGKRNRRPARESRKAARTRRAAGYGQEGNFTAPG